MIDFFFILLDDSKHWNDIIVKKQTNKDPLA